MSPSILASLTPVPEIRRTAEEVVARPEFQIDAPSMAPHDLLAAIVRFLERIFRPFRQFAENLYDLSPLLFWLMVVGLVLILVALITHIVYSFRIALARRAENISGLSRANRFIDPARLEADAKSAAAAGDYIRAVRLIFRACLARLEAAEARALRAGMTNRELLHRYRSTPMAAALQTFVETIDTKWYGHEYCAIQDYEACLQAQGIVQQHIKQVVASQAASEANRQAGGCNDANLA